MTIQEETMTRAAYEYEARYSRKEHPARRHGFAEGARWQRDQLAPPLKEALALVFPVPHFGEPEGLSSCPVNPFISPSTDEEIGPNNRYWTDGKRPVCDCGADETNARVRELLDSIGMTGDELVKTEASS